MTNIQIKFANNDGDYYFCNLCNEWHRYRTESDTPGHQHITHFDEEKTNSSSAKYYYCGSCNKWHTSSTKDHLQNRFVIKRDDNIKPDPSAKKLRIQQRRTDAHHSEDAEIGSFDGAAGLWKNEKELMDSIPSITARRQCEAILALVKSLDKDLHIQHFNRKNGFSFIVKGLKIAEIKLASGGFILTLIQNVLNQGYTSVHQEKKDFVYAGSDNLPVSDTDMRNHFTSEAKNLVELRKNNTIGYREKWLHSILIEKMQDGSLSGLDLEFLYYETPVGKVKRNKQFGREHIDILAKEKHSKALVVVEVKKEGEDLSSAVSQGLSYVEWLVKYRTKLNPRILQLGWDVDIENLKLIVLAPGMQIKNSRLDAAVLEQVKWLNCKVEAVFINSEWEKDEKISAKEILKFDDK